MVVIEDGQTVRVRTTIGQLFKSGDDQLEPGKSGLFDRIGKAIESERGPVTVEGHADSDRVSEPDIPATTWRCRQRAPRRSPTSSAETSAIPVG